MPEQEIPSGGEGAAITELEAEAAEVDSDVLSVRIEGLCNKIDDELEPGRTAFAEIKGREETALEFMDGSDRGAIFADLAQAILAHICSDAECYVRIKFVGQI